MKKRVFAVIAAAALCGTVSGMAGAEDLSSVMEQVRDANLNDTLLENHDRIAFRCSEYDVEGNVYSSYTYGDQERCVVETINEIMIFEQDVVYGFSNEDMMSFKKLFIDDARDDWDYALSYFIWDPTEIVEDCSEKDGKLYITTSLEDAEDLEAYAEMLDNVGYQTTDELSVQIEYVVASDTYEILEMTTYAYPDGETKVKYSEVVRVDNPDSYEVAPEIINGVFPDAADNTRLITVIADPDTAEEYTYTETVAKGSFVQVYLSWDHPHLYEDRECTQLYQGGSDLNEDLTLYTKLETADEENYGAAESVENALETETE